MRYSICPNPNNGFVYISDFYKGNVCVINLLGQEIKVQEYLEFLNLYNLSKGVFFIEIRLLTVN